MEWISETTGIRFWGAMEGMVQETFLFADTSPSICRLLYIHSGQGSLAKPVDGRFVHPVKSRELILLRAGEEYLLRVSGGPLHFSNFLVECSDNSLPSFAVLDQGASGQLRMPEPPPAGREGCADEWGRLLDLFRSAKDRVNEKAGDAPGGSSPAHALKEILDTRYAESLRLDALSGQLYTNKFRLVREFKKQYGVPPIEYLLNKRIGVAASLLVHTALKIGNIGERVGLENPTYFTRTFRAHMGCTPQEYRRALRKDARPPTAERERA